MNPAIAALGGILALGAVGGVAFYAGRATGEAEPQAAAEAGTAAPAPAPAVPAPAAAATPGPAAPAQPAAPLVPRRIDEAARAAELPTYSIELAAFRDLDRARDYAAVMAGRKLAVEMVETVDAGGRSWFRVRFGRFGDSRQAAARLPEVERVAGIYGVVTTEIPSPASQAR
jgi:cell division septation protein DedD